jgi:AcrR family transcriptional regulator
MKRKARKENTRKKIFKSALELFTSKGFEKTIIEDITKRANVAKGTFYNFFSKKEDVLVYYLESKIAESHEKFRINNGSNFIEQYKGLLSNYLNFIFKNKNFAKIILKERVMSQGSKRNPYELKIKQRIAQLVDLAKQREEIRDHIDTSRIVEVVTGINTLYIIYWVNGSLKNKEECIARICEAVDHFLHGIAVHTK